MIRHLTLKLPLRSQETLQLRNLQLLLQHFLQSVQRGPQDQVEKETAVPCFSTHSTAFRRLAPPLSKTLPLFMQKLHQNMCGDLIFQFRLVAQINNLQFNDHSADSLEETLILFKNFFRSQALIECEEEGLIAYVDTWYIHHDRMPRCEVPRAVKLFQDPAEWLTEILQPWHAEIDPTQDIMIYLVRPTPPCTPMECILAHLIIEQAQRPDHAVALITIQDANFRGATITHKAVSLHSIMNAPALIRVADMQALCQSRACSVRRGQIPYDFVDFDLVEIRQQHCHLSESPWTFRPL